MAIGIGRRQFISALGGAAAVLPLAVRAQQSALPVIGFLNGQSPDNYASFLAAFKSGLGEAGYVEGQNVAIEYRWAEGQSGRLPGLAADLVRRDVAVIVAAGGSTAGLAAKAATSTIPIVFNSGEDPVEAGLVTSLNHPSGNLTGVSWFNVEAAAKRVALLHEAIPAAAKIALFIDPTSPEGAATPTVAQDGANALGLQLIVLKANSSEGIETAFSSLLRQSAGALVIASGAYFISQRRQIITLAERHSIPVIYAGRESATDGGLMSYGNSLPDAYRRNGIYVARILKGDKPGDLPIDRSTKFELVINLKTANALGLHFPTQLLATADEVIE
jgi:putative tryptophan/tyrosine transport system substrate-binding protein